MPLTGEGVAGRGVIAGCTGFTGFAGFPGFAGFAALMQNQLFFTQVVHLAVLTKGSSSLLNFCTARKTLCMAAPGWQPSKRLTSRSEERRVAKECRSRWSP